MASNNKDELDTIHNDTSLDISVDTNLSASNGVSINGKNPSFIAHSENTNYNTSNTYNNNVVIINSQDSESDASKEQPKTVKDSPYNKIRTRYILISLTLLIIFATSVILVIMYRSKQYDSLMELADTYLNNENYDEAGALYHKASRMSINTSDFVKATSYEADCYLIKGMLSNSTNSNPLLESYYDKAIRTYNGILSNPKYQECDYFFDAAAGISNCYYFSKYPVNDTNWVKAVHIMEKRISDLYNTKDFSVLPQKEKLEYALALYYKCAIYSSTESMLDQELSKKALKYISDYLESSRLIYASNGINNYDMYAYCNGTASEILIICGLSSTNPKKYVSDAIKLCEDTLSNTQNNSYPISKDQQLYLNYCLGKAYYYQSLFSVQGDSTRFREKSHKILSPLLSQGDHISASQLADIGYYCAFTGKCSENDINQILNNINDRLKITASYKLQKEEADAMFQSLSTCAFICICYKQNQGAYELGKSISESLISKKESLNPEDSTTTQEYYDYFHGTGQNPFINHIMYQSLLK